MTTPVSRALVWAMCIASLYSIVAISVYASTNDGSIVGPPEPPNGENGQYYDRDSNTYWQVTEDGELHDLTDYGAPKHGSPF